MEQFIEETAAAFMAHVKEQQLDPAEAAKMARALSDGVAARLLQDAPPTAHIAAANAVVEVLDGDTGRLYRRYLELEYDENDNGVRLIGEDMAGKTVQVVFLSDAALRKMHELRGNGPDAPRCGE